MASHDSLPPHTHGSVQCRWLTATRAGLSSLLLLSFAWRTHIRSPYYMLVNQVICQARILTLSKHRFRQPEMNLNKKQNYCKHVK